MAKGIITPGIEKPRKNRAVITSFGTPIDLSGTLDDLKDGDSFIVDESRMRDYALIMGKRKGITLTSAKEETRYRIWR